MKLSELLTSYLEVNHVTLSQLAERTSISKATLSLMKRGINNRGEPEPSTPDISTLKKLACGMGVDLDELFKALDRDQTIAWDAADDQEPQPDGRVQLWVTAAEAAFIAAWRDLDSDDADLIVKLVYALAKKQTKKPAD